jgi:hypothetical protein
MVQHPNVSFFSLFKYVDEDKTLGKTKVNNPGFAGGIYI